MSPTMPLREREFSPKSVEKAYARVMAMLPGPDAAPSAWMACFREWNEVKRWADAGMTRRRFAESQDTRDPAAIEAMREVREQIEPMLEPNEARLRAAFLASDCREDLEAQLGDQLFVRMSAKQSAYEPSNIPLRTEEGQVAADYMRLLGSAEFEIDGEKLNMMGAKGFLSSPDAGQRKKAWDVLVKWMNDHAEDFHVLYDKLIRVRHQMALNLGEKTFVPVAYRRMLRSDYDHQDVAVFRQEILEHVVPVYAKLRAWQARQLGTELVQPHDEAYFPGLSLPPGCVPVEKQLAQLQELFDRLDPRLADHTRAMIKNDLIDLPTRPGKATGGFCTAFEDTGEAVIFCNSTGGADDVTTLTHEMGHAFNVWESMALPAFDLRWPGMDAAEVLSMGLELLSLPHIDVFFPGGEAAQYRRLLFVEIVTRLPYMATVDAFQHWVYEHPEHTHAEREAEWDRLWQTFMPGQDLTTAPHRTRWMRQLHLFKHPFYYIDYALAETGALQLWQLAEVDQTRAINAFIRLCKLGGTKPLVGFFEDAGLKSPFTPGLLGPLMQKVMAGLELG